MNDLEPKIHSVDALDRILTSRNGNTKMTIVF